MTDLTVNALFEGASTYGGKAMSKHFEAKAESASNLYVSYHAGTLFNPKGSSLHEMYFDGAIRQYGMMKNYLFKSDLFSQLEFSSPTFNSQTLWTTDSEGVQATIKRRLKNE